MTGYIFRCTNETEDECFQRKLFGEIDKYGYMLSQIKVGDSLYLFNITSGRFQGEFRAESAGQKNIEPNAWSGRFPWQVRISRVKEYAPLLRNQIDQVVVIKPKFRRWYPEVILNEEQILKLRALFEGAQILPKTEVEYRDKHSNKIKTDDGHLVRSWGEQAIDNWLFRMKISHGYERRLPIQENMFCDFYLQDQGEYVYIEYWGMEDEEYLKRKERKIQLYKQYGWHLIELVPKDLENLDEVLSKKLLKYFTSHRI